MLACVIKACVNEISITAVGTDFFRRNFFPEKPVLETSTASSGHYAGC